MILCCEWHSQTLNRCSHRHFIELSIMALKCNPKTICLKWEGNFLFWRQEETTARRQISSNYFVKLSNVIVKAWRLSSKRIPLIYCKYLLCPSAKHFIFFFETCGQIMNNSIKKKKWNQNATRTFLILLTR